jgi:hypothetical protein
MFGRAAKKLIHHSCSLPFFQPKIRYSAQAFFNQNINTNKELLMQAGNNFKNAGHILQAGRVYQAVIDIDPTDRRPYEELWDCFIIRGLKITEQELDKFEKNYRQYIKPYESSNTSKPR